MIVDGVAEHGVAEDDVAEGDGVAEDDGVAESDVVAAEVDGVNSIADGGMQVA